MKKYKLNLSAYQVEIDKPMADAEGQIIMDGKRPKTEKVMENYPLRLNLSDNLRGVGMFKTGEDVAEAVCLAKQLRNTEGDHLILDEKEAAVLKYAVDRLVALTAEGKAFVGGVVHEEMICRVFNMEVIEE